MRNSQRLESGAVTRRRMRLSDSCALGSVVYIMDKADGRGVEVWADGLLG